MAPAHMGQGSRVTYKSQSSSRQEPRAALAWAMASSSAWEATDCFSSRRLRPRPMTAPSLTMTQPTGTSPAAAASRARARAWAINCSCTVSMVGRSFD